MKCFKCGSKSVERSFRWNFIPTKKDADRCFSNEKISFPVNMCDRCYDGVAPGSPCDPGMLEGCDWWDAASRLSSALDEAEELKLQRIENHLSDFTDIEQKYMDNCVSSKISCDLEMLQKVQKLTQKGIIGEGTVESYLENEYGFEAFQRKDKTFEDLYEFLEAVGYIDEHRQKKKERATRKKVNYECSSTRSECGVY